MSLMGFIGFSNQYISNLYNPNENLSLVSQKKCDNVFSDPGVRSYILTFLFYQLGNLYICFFFLYVVIISLIQRGEGAGIYCKLIPG